jgi:hypothetical protein
MHLLKYMSMQPQDMCTSSGLLCLRHSSPGTYYIGSVQFQHGPCNASTLTFQLQASDQASCIALYR